MVVFKSWFLAGALVCAAPFATELFAGPSKTLRRDSWHCHDSTEPLYS